MTKVTRKNVLDAFRRYDDGELQEGRAGGRTWFVRGPSGRLYPLKHIWGLASGKLKFHTTGNADSAEKMMRRFEFPIIGPEKGSTTQPARTLETEIARMASTIKQTVKDADGSTKKGIKKVKTTNMDMAQLSALLGKLINQQGGRCALSGLELNIGEGGDEQLRPSADRIDSHGHYESDNLQVVCKFINFWKGSQEDDEFQRLLALVRKDWAPTGDL